MRLKNNVASAPIGLFHLCDQTNKHIPWWIRTHLGYGEARATDNGVTNKSKRTSRPFSDLFSYDSMRITALGSLQRVSEYTGGRYTQTSRLAHYLDTAFAARYRYLPHR